MSIAQQLTNAVQIAKFNKLINPRIRIRYPNDVRAESAEENLPVGNSVLLRSLEVTITQGGGTIEELVGDHEDGRKNVALAL